MIYLFEFFVFVLFDSYTYMPGLLKDSFYDSCLGAVVSNGFILPATCVIIAIYGIGIWWVPLIAAGFMGIEEIFIILGIYEHHWWKSIFTGMGLTLIFAFGKWLWKGLNVSELSKVFRFLVLYMNNVTLQGTLTFFYFVFFQQISAGLVR